MLNFYALIPAAGYGSRMGDELPKQYLRLAGRCSACKTRIALRYPIIELTTALLFAAIALARFGGRTLDSRFGRATALLAGLAYPLLLLESTGKALFLRGLVHGPRAILAFCALTFSIAVAIAVWRLGTGPVRTW